MPQSCRLSASLEDYIEAIYHIIDKKQEARGKDIIAALKVSGASVTEALRSLAAKGLVNYAPYEAITLTDQGRTVAEDVVRRHTALKRFFVEVLGIEPELAEKGACRVEHAAPPEIIDRMVNFIKFLETCPGENREMLSNFLEFCHRNESA